VFMLQSFPEKIGSKEVTLFPVQLNVIVKYYYLEPGLSVHLLSTGCVFYIWSTRAASLL
jgi:hypothetical protein